MNANNFNNLMNLLKCNKIQFKSFKWNNSFNFFSNGECIVQFFSLNVKLLFKNMDTNIAWYSIKLFQTFIWQVVVKILVLT